MEKAKMINTDNFEGNINIVNKIYNHLNKLEELQSEINNCITKEDEEEMWRQIEKNYLESSQK